MQLTKEEQRELFGDGFTRTTPPRPRSAGATPTPGRSRSAARRGTPRRDWVEIKARTERVGRRLRGGDAVGRRRRTATRRWTPPTAPGAHRRWFYACPHEMHRGLATCTSPTRGSRRRTRTSRRGSRTSSATRSTRTRTAPQRPRTSSFFFFFFFFFFPFSPGSRRRSWPRAWSAWSRCGWCWLARRAALPPPA